MKRITAALFIGLGLAALCAAQVQQASAGAGFRQEGLASWYGTEFDGRPTASGEIFNATLFTAAHPTLPFGTILTVTNRNNNKRVSVRVNDRGPFVSTRIIDLSRAAAEQLDMLLTGTAPVIIENVPPQQAVVTEPSTEPIVIQQYQPVQQIQQPIQQYQPVQQIQQPVQQPLQIQQPVQQYQPAPPQPPVQQPIQPQEPLQQVQPVQNISPPPPAIPVEIKPIPAPAPNKVYRIQVGSYKVARNAVEAFDKLKNQGLSPVYERNGEYFRVVLSGIRSEDVESVTSRIGAAGFKNPLFREE
ncbi:hypothetical protein FACS189491_00440 [Spirochaetia bacterium]|nr:hypothetical protein FACS189491_00440 [Spirochaetia bacterium]